MEILLLLAHCNLIEINKICKLKIDDVRNVSIYNKVDLVNSNTTFSYRYNVNNFYIQSKYIRPIYIDNPTLELSIGCYF